MEAEHFDICSAGPHKSLAGNLVDAIVRPFTAFLKSNTLRKIHSRSRMLRPLCQDGSKVNSTDILLGTISHKTSIHYVRQMLLQQCKIDFKILKISKLPTSCDKHRDKEALRFYFPPVTRQNRWNIHPCQSTTHPLQRIKYRKKTSEYLQTKATVKPH